MQRIESLLRKEIGLDAASIGSSAIERTVRQRLKHLGLKDTPDYERLLKTSRAELDELVEAVVVRETWFFRDRNPFSACQRLALDWLVLHPKGTLRVLSVPCSSGEEPYSLAIAFLDAHVPPDRFVINAVDISAHALARARQAVYGKNSFRGKELAFRDRHFTQTKEGYELKPSVRECVQFWRDNLLGDAFLAGHSPYDFIFCRNLLIYFDRATQVRALEKLHHLLVPQGALFLAPAELPLVANNGFVSANLPMAFACRKTAAHTEHQNGSAEKVTGVLAGGGVLPEKASGISAVRELPAPRPPARMPSSSVTRKPTAIFAGRSVSAAPSDLEAARQLADAGHLEKAATVCQAHLRDRGPSAQAYYLLGLIRDAGGDPQAIEFYRKALYLQPNHYETLLQMSLLLEKTGDAAGARIFKRRAQRAQQKA